MQFFWYVVPLLQKWCFMIWIPECFFGCKEACYECHTEFCWKTWSCCKTVSCNFNVRRKQTTIQSDWLPWSYLWHISMCPSDPIRNCCISHRRVTGKVCWWLFHLSISLCFFLSHMWNGILMVVVLCLHGFFEYDCLLEHNWKWRFSNTSGPWAFIEITIWSLNFVVLQFNLCTFKFITV